MILIESKKWIGLERKLYKMKSTKSIISETWLFECNLNCKHNKNIYLYILLKYWIIQLCDVECKIVTEVVQNKISVMWNLEVICVDVLV